MSKTDKNLIILTVIIVAAFGAVYWFYPSGAPITSPAESVLDGFAKCLAAKGVTMYGADWCPHCQNEKRAFGESFKYVPYVECPADPQKCLEKGIAGYPTWIFGDGRKIVGEQGLEKLSQESGCPLPSQGAILPIQWGDLGAQMVAAGVIDRAGLEALYAQRGGLANDEKQFLETSDGNMIITQENSGFVLNLFWALGLSNKNKILEEGPMMDSRYGGADRFASTGGWTLAKGDAMNHYGKHPFITLTSEQQVLVEKVSKNIYRPCCDNSTYFPDCNHGMAMLGLLELLTSQGVSESEIYKVALQVNSLWFPEQYATIARYLESKGRTLQTADPKEILGEDYSSASGFSRIAALVPQVERQGGGCGL